VIFDAFEQPNPGSAPGQKSSMISMVVKKTVLFFGSCAAQVFIIICHINTTSSMGMRSSVGVKHRLAIGAANSPCVR
jgi:hypothetical protein